MGLELGVKLVLASLFLSGALGGADARGKERDQKAKKGRPVLAKAKTMVGGTYRLVSFEQYNASTFVSRCEIVAGVIELDCRDDVGC